MSNAVPRRVVAPGFESFRDIPTFRPRQDGSIASLRRHRYDRGMKWLITSLLALALLLSGYVLYKVNRTESASKPRVRLIVAEVR